LIHRGVSSRLAQALHTLWFFVDKTFWPRRLLPVYDFPEKFGLSSPVVLPAAAVVLFITGAAVRCLRRRPAISVAWFFYVLMLVPALGVAESRSLTFDRFGYLPCLSFAFLFGGAFWLVREKSAVGPKKHLYTVVVAGALFLLAVRARAQIGVWRDSKSLWGNTLRANPQSSTAYNNMGLIFWKEGRPDLAAKYYSQAIQRKPRNADAWNNLGVVFDEQGKLDMAKDCYVRAVRIAPRFAEAWSNLGIVFGQKREYEQAVRCFRKSLQYRPDRAEFFGNLGMAQAALRRYPEAVRSYESALKRNPGLSGVRTRLGLLLEKQERWEEAETHYRALLRGGDDPYVSLRLGVVLMRRGEFEESLRHFDRAFLLNPALADARAHLNVGTVLMELARDEEAEEHLREALRMRPRLKEARDRLRAIRSQRKKE